MWQLSWREPDRERATELAGSGPEVLRAEVERRCRDWHAPVLDMVRSTPPGDVWGTGLQDRSPSSLGRGYLRGDGGGGGGGGMRVVAMGDAAHAMSCFKGQGANQALADGPLLADWLRRAAVPSAVRGFMREMCQRTEQIVRASREAATFLHCPDVLGGGGGRGTQDFAGVREGAVPAFLEGLRAEGIGASLGAGLDGAIRRKLEAEGDAYLPPGGEEEEGCGGDEVELASLRAEALGCASGGDTAGLRRLPPQAIHGAKDAGGRTCLHLAALGGHYHSCRYLLTESCLPHTALDASNSTPLHCACLSRDRRTVHMFAAISKGDAPCWDRNKDGNTPEGLASACEDEHARKAILAALK